MDNKFSFRRVFLVAALAILVIIMLIALAGRFIEADPEPVILEAEPSLEVEVVKSPLVSDSGLLRVSEPQANATVTNPIVISGEARGYWFFEGSFPVTVVDWNGLIIGEGYVTAETEWMTEEFVAFKGEVSFDLPLETPYKRGALILKKDNPSDLPELDDSLEVPILFE